MGGNCEDCCRNCCYSTPLLTLTTACFTGLGLMGFTLSGLYGVIKMDTVPHIQNGTVVMAPIVCGAIMLTFLPIVLVTIMAYCVTGYIRDIFFHSTTKSCIGSVFFNTSWPSFGYVLGHLPIATFDLKSLRIHRIHDPNICTVPASEFQPPLCFESLKNSVDKVLVTLLGYILLWIAMAIGLGGVTAYYLQAEIFCTHRNLEVVAGLATCFYYVDTDFQLFPICEDADLNSLCSRSEGLSVGLAYTITLVFSVMVILGLVALAILHTYNFVSARDHIDCRENTRNEYDMKRVS